MEVWSKETLTMQASSALAVWDAEMGRDWRTGEFLRLYPTLWILTFFPFSLVPNFLFSFQSGKK